MHRMLFSLKRVHLLAVEFSKQTLRVSTMGMRLTPARFDMMRIVHVHDLQDVSVAQSAIQLLLGVSAATVSRMLRALEGLGLIARTRDERDGRCNNVRLTPRGRIEVRGVMNDLIEEKLLDICLDDIVEPHRRRIRTFTEMLDFFRNNLWDPAPFAHPWRCGQLDTGWPLRFFSPPRWPFAPREPRRR